MSADEAKEPGARGDASEEVSRTSPARPSEADEAASEADSSAAGGVGPAAIAVNTPSTPRAPRGQSGEESGLLRGSTQPPPATGVPDPTDKPPHTDTEPQTDDAVWTYRGYELRAGEFNTAMVHLFRGEITRSNMWRQRLDATTNWAVLTTGAAISFAFSAGGTAVAGEGSEHGVIILSTLLVTIFLMAEARRYRYYELWSSRVRLMETDFFAAMLVPPFHPSPDWAESLAENLLHPEFPISRWEALGRRFRRNYMWIYVLLGVAWLLKVWLHPVQAYSESQLLVPEIFFANAAIGPIPGQLIVAVGLAFNVFVMAAGMLTIGLQQSAGEVLPRYGPAVRGVKRRGERAWFRPSRKRSQLVTFIVTGKPDAVAAGILSDLHRGVTSMPARGMYSGDDRAVLLCALTVTEVAQLRSVVESVDRKAFVIVSPVEQVLGEGFRPLEEERTGPREEPRQG